MKMTPQQTTVLSLVSVMSLLHLLIANRAGLTVDGAHYALYGKHLALSYYDHPPLVGYLQALILPWGHSNLMIRLWPIFLSWCWPLLLYRLSQQLFPQASPWQSVVCVALALSAVLINLMSLALIPQVPLLFFGLIALSCLYQAVETNLIRYWLGFGFTLGLAGLAEYTAICIAVAAVIYTLTHRPKALASIGPWLAVLIALAVISPVIIWNVQHDWLSIKFQLTHGNHHPDWRWSRFLISELRQWLSYSPGFMLLTLCGLYTGLKKWRHRGTYLLLCMSVPTLLLFGYESGYQPSLPHWPALGWIAATPLGAQFICQHWQSLIVKIVTGLSALLALLMILIVHAEIYQPYLPFKDYQNPLKDIYGWQAAAKQANQRLNLLQKAHPQTTLQLFVPNWSLASRLAWYSNRPVQVASNRYARDQFTLWYGNPQTGASGLLVVPHGWGNPPKTGQRGQFQNCRFLDKLPLVINQRFVNQFNFYYCHHFKSVS